MHRDALRSGERLSGFSLIELMAAILVSSVVMVGVLSMFTVENRRMSQQRELGDAWLTLRTSAELMAYDLRHAAAGGLDLSALTDTAFTVRSRRGSGVICGASATGFGLANVTGEFSAETGDSVQAMTVDATSWKNLRVSTVGDAGAVGPTNCAWPGNPPSSMGVMFAGTASELAGVNVGSPVHVFRSTRYGIMTSGGRRWLGRKVGDANWEIVTGPLRADGLRLTYYTSTGTTTTTPANVAAVRITLRGESFGRTAQRTMC